MTPPSLPLLPDHFSKNEVGSVPTAHPPHTNPSCYATPFF